MTDRIAELEHRLAVLSSDVLPEEKLAVMAAEYNRSLAQFAEKLVAAQSRADELQREVDGKRAVKALNKQRDWAGLVQRVVLAESQLRTQAAALSDSERMAEALEDMIYQFAYQQVVNGQPGLCSGGLSALEGAFDALGWEDPHAIANPVWCAARVTPRCPQQVTSGVPEPDGYKHYCSEHFNRVAAAPEEQGL